jgi:hypothetical protein
MTPRGSASPDTKDKKIALFRSPVAKKTGKEIAVVQILQLNVQIRW